MKNADFIEALKLLMLKNVIFMTIYRKVEKRGFSGPPKKGQIRGILTIPLFG